MSQYKIYDELEKIKTRYNTRVNILENANNQIGALRFLQKDVIRMIEFYSSSKYLNGQKDELGRDKPFYNILNGVVDTENSAKDIDTKQIEIISQDGEHTHEAFMMNKEVKVWMNVENFAKTLNEMRDIHSRYGSLLVKKYNYTGDDGKKHLCIEMPAWKNVWNDQVDILNSPIVEIHWMLPSELLAMDGWQNQGDAIKQAMQNDRNRYRVPVYEMRGEFPRAYYKQVADPEYQFNDEELADWSYQLYYLAGEIGQNMICLYSEDDTERVYKYLARKAKPGRSFGVGVIEEGEEAQVWTNDAVLKQYRAMEYSSKVVGQSASRKLKGRNMLTEVDDGQILEHEDGKPITTVPLVPPGGMAQFNNIISQWWDQFERASSAYDAQRGAGGMSHTPYRLQALMLQQSKGVFLQLQQQFGILIEEIFNDWVMPFLVEQLTPAHILSSEFTPEELKDIDGNYATYVANQEAKTRILSGQIVTPEDYDSFVQQTKDAMGKNKGRRFLSIPKNYYKNLKAKVYVIVTGEQKDKAQVLDSITNIMMIYAKNPGALQDPVLALLFKEAVAMSGIGISSVQLMGAINEQAKNQAAQAQTQPQPGAPTAPNGAPTPTAPVPPQPVTPQVYAPTR